VAQNDLARPGKQFLPIFRRQEASRYDFRLRLDQAGMFVDGDDRHHEPILGEMLASRMTNSSISSSEPESTQTRPAVTGSRRLRSVVGEFDWLAVFDQKNFSRHHADVVRKARRGGIAGGIRRGPE